MSESNRSSIEGGETGPVPPDAGLQFDQADFDTAAAPQSVCASCQKPIDDLYYEAGGKVVCAQCRAAIETALKGGSPVVRAIKGLLFGTVAAIAGALIYYLVIRITNYNIGLIAILVGFMVGKAVRKGSANRGGAFYQAMAVGLCYLAIVWMHVPFVLEAMINAPQISEEESKKLVAELNDEMKKAKDERLADKKAGAAVLTAKPSPTEPAKPEPKPSATPGPDMKAAPGTGAKQIAKTEPVPEPAEKAAQNVDADEDDDAPQIALLPAKPAAKSNLWEILVGIIMLTAVMLPAPILVAKENPITGFIFAFALWEAWKVNLRAVIALNGPFRLSRKDKPVEEIEGAAYDA
jgi:hypothetical protein